MVAVVVVVAVQGMHICPFPPPQVQTVTYMSSSLPRLRRSDEMSPARQQRRPRRAGRVARREEKVADRGTNLEGQKEEEGDLMAFWWS
jgi:hypothetical protein